jgi:hypothetical protein
LPFTKRPKTTANKAATIICYVFENMTASTTSTDVHFISR